MILSLSCSQGIIAFTEPLSTEDIAFLVAQGVCGIVPGLWEVLCLHDVGSPHGPGGWEICREQELILEYRILTYL